MHARMQLQLAIASELGEHLHKLFESWASMLDAALPFESDPAPAKKTGSGDDKKPRGEVLRRWPRRDADEQVGCLGGGASPLPSARFGLVSQGSRTSHRATHKTRFCQHQGCNWYTAAYRTPGAVVVGHDIGSVVDGPIAASSEGVGDCSGACVRKGERCRTLTQR